MITKKCPCGLWSADPSKCTHSLSRDSLDAAWAEVEPLLPAYGGWQVRIQVTRIADDPARYRICVDGERFTDALGPTLAAAFRTVAAKLREVKLDER